VCEEESEESGEADDEEGVEESTQLLTAPTSCPRYRGNPLDANQFTTHAGRDASMLLRYSIAIVTPLPSSSARTWQYCTKSRIRITPDSTGTRSLLDLITLLQRQRRRKALPQKKEKREKGFGITPFVLTLFIFKAPNYMLAQTLTEG